MVLGLVVNQVFFGHPCTTEGADDKVFAAFRMLVYFIRASHKRTALLGTPFMVLCIVACEKDNQLRCNFMTIVSTCMKPNICVGSRARAAYESVPRCFLGLNRAYHLRQFSSASPHTPQRSTHQPRNNIHSEDVSSAPTLNLGMCRQGH